MYVSVNMCRHKYELTSRKKGELRAIKFSTLCFWFDSRQDFVKNICAGGAWKYEIMKRKKIPAPPPSCTWCLVA